MRYPAEAAGGDRQTIVVTSFDGNANPTGIEHRASEAADSARIRFAHSYDLRNRLTSRQAFAEQLPADPPEFFGTDGQTFAYDDLGRLVRATDATRESLMRISSFRSAISWWRRSFSSWRRILAFQLLAAWPRAAVREKRAKEMAWIAPDRTRRDQFLGRRTQDRSSVTGIRASVGAQNRSVPAVG